MDSSFFCGYGWRRISKRNEKGPELLQAPAHVFLVVNGY